MAKIFLKLSILYLIISIIIGGLTPILQKIPKYEKNYTEKVFKLYFNIEIGSNSHQIYH
jgi:predicted PurR-regulated permease PerM